ncbi:MAG: hypothetical protein HY537_09185 [Deltaproteobacteria bacterium]|nr:hypothetical protein [Deltaproteobacteria bacterium]
MSLKVMLLLAFLITVPAHAWTISVQGACTDSEKWEVKGKVPAEMLDLFKSIPTDPDKNIEKLKSVISLQANSHRERKIIADFWFFRTLFQLGLIHPSQSGFARVASESKLKGLGSIQRACVQCLAKIHTDRRHLPFSKQETNALLQIPMSQIPHSIEELFWELRARWLLKQLSEDEPNQPQPLERNLALFESNNQYKFVAEALVLLQRGEKASMAKRLSELLRNNRIPASFSPIADFGHLVLARLEAENAQYAAALSEYGKISQRSQWYFPALLESAWISLHQKNYERAIGLVYNLHGSHVPPSLTAEGLIIASIAFSETCYFPEAKRALHILKKAFSDSYGWLDKLERSKKQDLYALAVNFVNKKHMLPSPVAAEWLRSPLFLAGQEEINLILDERQMLETLLKRLIPLLDIKGKAAAAHYLVEEQKHGHLRESALISQLNRDLSIISTKMFSRLRERWTDGRMIEIEILSKAGDEMRSQPSQNDSLAAAGFAVWRWGKQAALSLENDEIWADELGAFRAAIKSKCPK